MPWGAGGALGGSRGPPDPVSRPQNGSVILYNRKKVKYRKDGYCWKKRKDGKTTREDHMKLKVQGVEVGGGGPQNRAPPPHRDTRSHKKSTTPFHKTAPGSGRREQELGGGGWE